MKRYLVPILVAVFLALGCDGEGSPIVPSPPPGPPPPGPPPCSSCECDPSLCPPPPPEPPPPPPPGPKPLPPLYPIKTDFLTLTIGQNQVIDKHYVVMSQKDRAEVRASLHRKGYNAWFQEALHEKTARYDYLDTIGAPDFLQNPNAIRLYLQELRDDGIHPIIGFSIEDAPRAEDKYTLATFISAVRSFVRLNDDLISAYALAIEIDEWLPRYDDQDALGSAIRKETSKPIFPHYRKTIYRNALSFAWSSGIFYQFGTSGITASQVRSVTRSLAPKFAARGKKFIAFEYEKRDEAHARMLGRAALAAGSWGCGNGC